LPFVPALVIVPALVASTHAQNAQQNTADADRLIKAMAVKAGSIVAEIGAGDGELTAAMAAAVAETGRVQSKELNEDRLAGIRTRVEDGVETFVILVAAAAGPWWSLDVQRPPVVGAAPI